MVELNSISISDKVWTDKCILKYEASCSAHFGYEWCAYLPFIGISLHWTQGKISLSNFIEIDSLLLKLWKKYEFWYIWCMYSCNVHLNLVCTVKFSSVETFVLQQRATIRPIVTGAECSAVIVKTENVRYIQLSVHCNFICKAYCTRTF